MNIDEARARALDEVVSTYVGELRRSCDDNGAVTLAYSQSLHKSWRTILRMLPVSPGWSVLDVGSGFGILGFELAANVAVSNFGVELNPHFAEHAEVLRQRLADLGLFTPGSAPAFEVGDVRALPFGDRTFDLVFVREVLQFLPDPIAALAEVLRVLRPGAYLCISDTDDQLRITWPPPAEAFERLVASVTQVQIDRGGDRQTGRKLTTYLRSVGFEIASVVVLPEAQHRLVDSADAERTLVIEQLHAARHRVLSAGVVDSERFDADLAWLERQEPFEEFRLNGRIVVVGRKPGSDVPQDPRPARAPT